jgi:uncharacterized OB-fold protein
MSFGKFLRCCDAARSRIDGARVQPPRRIGEIAMSKTAQQTDAKPRLCWISKQNDGLVASKDIKTGKCIFPRVPETSPSASRYTPIDLSRQGKLYSFTVIHPNPKTGEKPFTLAYVDFPEGARAFGRLSLPKGETARIGMAVAVCVHASAQAGAFYHFIPHFNPTKEQD